MDTKYKIKSKQEQAEDLKYFEYMQKGGKYYIEEYFEQMLLTNKLGIEDVKALSDVERKVSAFKNYDLEKNPLKGNIDFTYLQNIHSHLFGDIYYWAGTFRPMDMEIDSVTKFCPAAELQNEGKKIFDRLNKKNNLKSLDKKNFVKELSEFMTDLNILHPFREGNGRSKRALVTELAKQAGYKLDFGAVDKKAWILADETAFDTSKDSSQKRDTTYLKMLLDSAIKPLTKELEQAKQPIEPLTVYGERENEVMVKIPDAKTPTAKTVVWLPKSGIELGKDGKVNAATSTLIDANKLKLPMQENRHYKKL